MHFELTTPERVLERDEIEGVTASTPMGEITILPGHLPLVTPITPGLIHLKKKNGESDVFVAGGFLEVRPDDVHGTRVILLADEAERAEEIDEERAREAQERAKRAMQEYRTTDEVKFAEATAAFERAFARLKVAKRKRHH